MIDVRQLGAADLDAYRSLHALSLRQAPTAFAETDEQDAARSNADVAAFLASGVAWGAFDSARLIAKLVMDAPPYPAFAHTRWFHAVYVRPDARGQGAGRALVEAAITAGRRAGAFRFLLWVNSENAAARGLYEALGFREVGRIPLGIRIEQRFVDDVMMCLTLDPPALDAATAKS